MPESQVHSESTAAARDALLDAARALHARAGDRTYTPAGSQTAQPVTDRLAASVIRPLAARSEALETRTDSNAAVQPFETEIASLALQATELCATSEFMPALLEAAAALQELACDSEPAYGTDRFVAFRALLQQLPASIRIASKGPLLVTNVTDLHDSLGRPLPARPITALCRCGASAMKPYCDGSHAGGFEDAKDAGRVADRRDTYVGQQVTILDNRGTCQHSGFCTSRLATAFRVDREPFVAPSGGRMDELIRAVRDCPSGALGYAIDGVEARADTDYHETRTPSIEVSKDGPYRIVGNIALLDDDGADIERNDGASREHATLCRCGHAQNKPFCTGMHWYVDFKDPVLASDDTPTVFEYAGGLPALTRMTRLFYEKFVPADELLAPLFAEMSADHPQRVAAWLGEVFCGPKSYSEAFGGYTRMISQHLGKCLTEEMRARWVALLLQAARETGLPNDAEFRAAFGSYIEWGTRLAVENSQVESRPPEHMPMPHWDWETSAGPPCSRLSALAATTEEPVQEPVLPGPQERVEFAKRIAGLFRARDRKSMKFVFDLSSYDDVSTHAEAILARVRDGTMPCDGKWPQERVDTFARWIEAGKPR